MSVVVYTKTGNKSTSTAKISKSVFGVEAKNHDLLKQAYLTYLCNGRVNLAKTKTRGLVSGGGRKPWRQKGTGRARFGSSRNPIWRGGGIAFGPTGQENYSHKLSINSKRQAIRQALSIMASSNKIVIIETFDCSTGKVSPTVKLINKMKLKGKILLVVSKKDIYVERATKNVQNLVVAQAKYLNVYDILNTDYIVISSKALTVINQWLGEETEK